MVPLSVSSPCLFPPFCISCRPVLGGSSYHLRVFFLFSENCWRSGRPVSFVDSLWVSVEGVGCDGSVMSSLRRAVYPWPIDKLLHYDLVACMVEGSVSGRVCTKQKQRSWKRPDSTVSVRVAQRDYFYRRASDWHRPRRRSAVSHASAYTSPSPPIRSSRRETASNDHGEDPCRGIGRN